MKIQDAEQPEFRMTSTHLQSSAALSHEQIQSIFVISAPLKLTHWTVLYDCFYTSLLSFRNWTPDSVFAEEGSPPTMLSNSP
jgi:hypothetical protein